MKRSFLSNLRKYGRLFLAFLRASFQADIEYRVNFATRILTDILWYIAQIVTIEAIFLYTTRFGDWNLPQVRVFLGLLFVVDALYMILFSDNFDRLSDKVRKGDLDLLLTKPVNSQFILSLQKMGTAMFGNLLLGLLWLVWALAKLPDFNWARVLWLMLLIPCGLTALYGVRFMLSTTALIFTRSENLQYLWYQVYRLGMRPDSIYAMWLKYIIMTILPVALIASVPSRFLLEAPDFGLLCVSVGTSVTFLYLSHRFWNYALKFYSSASS